MAASCRCPLLRIMNRYLSCFVIFLLCNAPTVSFAQPSGRDTQSPPSPQTNDQNNPALPKHETPAATAATQNASENTADNPIANPNADEPNASPNVRTRRRTIVNREFDDKEKITLLLNAHCDFPSRDDLLSVSNQAESLLLEIYADESILLSVRMRAVQALSYFSSPQNRETLEDILAHPENVEHILILIQAIRAYAAIAPNDAPKKLEPFLSDASDFVRFITIDSLKSCPGNAALHVLQSQYERETNRFFKTRLKQAIDNHCKKSSCASP